MVGEVVPGLGFGHAGQGVAQRDPLVEGGEGAEFDPPTQGGLAEQQPGELTVCREASRLPSQKVRGYGGTSFLPVPPSFLPKL